MSWTPGLRGRITAALLAVGALTLAVAALALLVPLDALFRRDALSSLRDEARTARPRLDALPAADITPGSPRLQLAVRRLAHQAGSDAILVDDRGQVLATSDPDAGQQFDDVARALREQHIVSAVVHPNEGREAQVALPLDALDAHGRHLGLAMRKSLRDVDAARDVVARALLVAGAIGLVVALLAGSVLAGRLVRRLAALRDTSLRVAELGPLAEVQDDDARDEVGDLTRAFATMQQRLRDQEQARRTFVATASHELRTPLTSLLLLLHGAHDELDRPEPDLPDTREQLGRAVRQTERLRKLAAELLDLSRLDAGVPLRSEPVELVELARSVIAEFEPRGELRLQAPEREWVQADPSALAQILRIMVDNALRHAPPGTPVEVDLHRADGRPSITVSDQGPGVAAEDAERIFDRFERGQDMSGDSGFGLGLPIGRELAERMGGDLALAGTGPGGRFRVVLPEAEDESV